MQQYFPSSSSISNGQYPISCPSSPTPRDANLPQVTDEQARPEEGLQVVMPPATEKGMPWAEPGAGGSRRPQGALPFGLGGWAFGFLIAAIAAICVGAAVGGGLGAALAECRRSESSSGGGGSTVTVTQIATAAAETPGTTDGAYSPMSPGKVATLALECDDEEEDYRAYRSRYWEVNFEQYCGVSYSTGDEAGEGGPNVDISTVVAYSVDDCMDACAAINAKLDRFKMEGERCRAVTFRVELGEYVEASGGNCWLKNGTKPGEQKSSSEGGTPTRAYARIVD